MKRVIITGATGAIGTALIKECIKKRIEVLVFCHKGSKRNDLIPENDLIKKIYYSLDELESLMPLDSTKYDAFYHLAWEGTTGKARDDMYLQNRNAKYALDAVSVAKRFGCGSFIGVGSQAEYGRVEGVVKANSPTFPMVGYGIGKLSAGLMTRQFAHQLNLRHVWIRVLSIYGPNDNPSSMVMTTIRSLQNGEMPKLTKGEQIWDYLYSGDAARAMILIGEMQVDNKIYVLGSGNAKRLRSYVEDIRDVVSPNAELIFGSIDYYPNQVMHLQADISELEVDLGWRPQISFKEGIKRILSGEMEDEHSIL